MLRKFAYVFLLLLFTQPLWSQESKLKVRSKKTFSNDEGLKLLREEELFDTDGRLLVKSLYVYDGKNVAYTEKQYYYYHAGADSILFYKTHSAGKDSVLTMRRLIHKKKGSIVKMEFFENLQTKTPIYSYIAASLQKKGKDSTITERVKLYNGDSSLRTFTFRNNKIISSQEIKKGKLYSHASYTYNDKGQLVQKNTSDAVWGTSSEESFEYENGHRSKSTETITEKNGEQRTTYYTYDEKGNETSLVCDRYIGRYKNEMASQSVKTTYVYKDGLMVENTSVSKNIYKTVYLYEYTFY